MAKLEVVKWPAKVLETKALPVRTFDDELKSFVADMRETMTASQGIGLAANQVDRLLRVLTIYIPYTDQDKENDEKQAWWHNQYFDLINPEIVAKSGSVKCMEGCLSFPDVYETIERAEFVTVKAFDVDGKPIEIKADGLFSICLQHEVDHLDGITFISRMSRLKNRLVRKKLQKRLATSEA